MTTRIAARAAVVLLTGMSAFVASPAFAAVKPDDGDEPGEALSGLATLALFVGAPVLLFVVIALLVMLPSMAKGPRYRPGLGWQGGAEWYGGPEGEVEKAAPESTDSGTSARW